MRDYYDKRKMQKYFSKKLPRDPDFYSAICTYAMGP